VKRTEFSADSCQHTTLPDSADFPQRDLGVSRITHLRVGRLSACWIMWEMDQFIDSYEYHPNAAKPALDRMQHLLKFFCYEIEFPIRG
jgi:hypothetical protein